MSSFTAFRLVAAVVLSVAPSAGQQSRLLRSTTYLGGTGGDDVSDLAVAPDGTIYVAGATASRDFPVTAGAIQREPRGRVSAFVARLSPDGAKLMAATLLGGTGDTRATAVAVDQHGNVYLAGATVSASGFPLTPAAHRAIYGAGFVVKLSPDLDRLIYSTLTQEAAADLAVDRDGNAYLTGTAGADFVTTGGVFQPQHGGGECFAGRPSSTFPCPDTWVAKLDPHGSALVFATRLGGRAEEEALAVAVDAAGNAWVSGATASPDFPTTVDALDRRFHGRREFGPLWYGDGFLVKISSDGRRLLYSTYFGGAEPDAVSRVVIDRTGHVHVAGWTESWDLPVTAGAFRTAYGGPLGVGFGFGGDGFVAKFTSEGALVWATYLGGSHAERSGALAVDTEGRVYVGGSTSSPDFPVTPCSIPACPSADPGLYASAISADGARLERSTRLGGFGLDLITATGFVAQEKLLAVAGVTRSLAFLATPGAFQPLYQGGDTDGFLALLDLDETVETFVACVVHAATLRPGGHPQFPSGAVSPGQLVTLHGVGLGPADGVIARPGADGRLPTALAGTSILFGGTPAPLLYASDAQVNAAVPFAAAGNLTLEIERHGTRTTAWVLPVVPATPGILTADGTGRGLAATLNEDGSVNSFWNRAPRGSIIVFFATGLGLLGPAMADGEIAPLALPLPVPRLGVSVLIGGRPAELLYAGQAPGIVAGVVQINARTPEDVPISSGDFAWLQVFAGEYPSLNYVTVAVR